MRTWNYRVVRSIEKGIDGDTDQFAIHEAHYDTPDGEPRAITENAITTSFDSVDELRNALTRMLASLDKPVLNYEDF